MLVSAFLALAGGFASFARRTSEELSLLKQLLEREQERG
jgi:hypothetical protein